MRPIVELDGRYFASADGRIWSTITDRFLKMALRKDGYFYVIVRHKGRSLNRAVHRLVCAAWHGAPPTAAHQCNHKNLNKTCNQYSNLEWVTPLENTSHAWANLPPDVIAWMRQRRRFGALTMNRKKRTLTSEQADQIRQMVGGGRSQTQVAAFFGRSRSTIDAIVKGETYVD